MQNPQISILTRTIIKSKNTRMMSYRILNLLIYVSVFLTAQSKFREQSA